MKIFKEQIDYLKSKEDMESITAVLLLASKLSDEHSLDVYQMLSIITYHCGTEELLECHVTTGRAHYKKKQQNKERIGLLLIWKHMDSSCESR